MSRFISTDAHAPPQHVDASRPFFAHLRMPWWRVIVVAIVLMAMLFVLQFLPGAIVVPVLAAIEGEQLLDDPATLAGHPAMVLSANIALGLLIPAALLVMHRIGGVPWRSVLALGRDFSWRRLFTLLAVMAPVFAAALLAIALFVPGSFGAVTVTGATVVLLAVTVLTMPLASAAEEVVFRGGIGPAVGSRFRGEKAAVAAGLVVSTLLFGFMHFSGDPWLIAYQLSFGLIAGLMALSTRGVEAPIAFHAAHNVMLFVAAAVTSGGGAIAIDRSASEGSGTMVMTLLLLLPCDLLLLAIVHLMERRRRSTERHSATTPQPGARSAAGFPSR